LSEKLHQISAETYTNIFVNLKMIRSLIFIFLFFNTLQVCLGQTFPFFTGKFADLQAKAKVENKPYFAYFYTNWCMPCKKMNEMIFTDADFVRYASANYYGYVADAEATITEGRKIAEKYSVVFFPMIIVFTPEGMVSERIDGFLDAKQMIALLKRNAPIRGTPTGEYLYKNDDPPRAAFIQPRGKGLFKVYMETQKSEGFGVKIGTFFSYEETLEKIKFLQSKFHRNIILHLDEKEGKPIYEVILGPFQSQRSALTYNEVLLQKNGYEGVVVDLAYMK
jgi:thiol-disulfide isomerase/thioredoxin